VILLLVLALAAPVVAAPPPEDVALYRTWCARCHGDAGDGKGPAAAALAFNGAPPRDFTAGRFKLGTVKEGAAPTDADLARVIASGITGTSMPWFSDLLSAAEIARLAGVVRSFAKTPRPAGAPIDLGDEPADDDASRARGKSLFTELGCPACHGPEGRGDGASASQLRGADGSAISPADLTRPWTFKGGGAARDVTMRLVAGIGGTPMPSYLDAASTAQLWDVAHVVGTLARAPSLRDAAIVAARTEPGADVPLAKRGEYLAKSGTCFLCHAQMRPDGGYVPDAFGAGGMRVDLATMGTVYTRNVTGDPDAGIGRWSAADLGHALRDGRAPNGRVLSPLDMPWTVLAGLTDRDVEALHAFLTKLPPAKNVVPPPHAASLVDGVVRKLEALVGGAELSAAYVPGNAGHAKADGETIAPATNPRTELWLVAALVVLAVVARRRVRRLVVALGVAIVALYAWPGLRWMPSELVKAEAPFETLGRAFALPPVRRPPPPVGMDDEETRVLAERGRYVATVGTCTLCHTAGPSVTRLWAPFPELGGGMRVRWNVFGTVCSRNLTPDPTTGLGSWSDAEMTRAITSGLARDGRAMHWQAMPWDHFSRLSPEDLVALVTYLRRVPALRSEIPPPVPPAAGDPDALTFFLGYDGTQR
jgi:mono/diheme cytochrome c family protein